MAFTLYDATQPWVVDQVNAIARSHFSLDTATPETAATWYAKNPKVLVAAAYKNEIIGYADFLPLTATARTQIEERALDEEDMTGDHVLAPSHMDTCTAIYFAGIAVKNGRSLLAARCVAALLAGSLNQINTLYRRPPLEVIYANPTTFAGNKLTKRLQLTPVSFRKIKMGGMDLYMLPLLGQENQAWEQTLHRYHRFIAG